jgi:hypothetical protein
MIQQPEAPILLSHYEFFRKALTLSFIFAIHLSSGLYKWILLTLSDVVPSLVFYYAAKTLQCIEFNLKKEFNSFRQLPRSTATPVSGLTMIDKTLLGPADSQFQSQFCHGLRHIWSNYETFVDLVKKTNNIFGYLMFLDHGMKFFLICTVFAQFLSSFTDPNVQMLAPMSASLTFIFRYTASILLAAKLYHMSSQMKESALSQYSRACFHMSSDEREMFNLFISRLQDSPLAARPLDLYSIDKSLLLAILSLTISYVIVVVQMHPTSASA